MSIRQLVQLRDDGIFDARIPVPDCGDGGAACGVEDSLAVLEVEVIA